MHTALTTTKNTLQTETTLDVAIQGYLGAFHDIASRQYFENHSVNIVPGDTFDDLVDLIKNKTADIGLMAIENTLAGSIVSNYYRLLENNLKATG